MKRIYRIQINFKIAYQYVQLLSCDIPRFHFRYLKIYSWKFFAQLLEHDFVENADCTIRTTLQNNSTYPQFPILIITITFATHLTFYSISLRCVLLRLNTIDVCTYARWIQILAIFNFSQAYLFLRFGNENSSWFCNTFIQNKEKLDLILEKLIQLCTFSETTFIDLNWWYLNNDQLIFNLQKSFQLSFIFDKYLASLETYCVLQIISNNIF